MSRKDAALDLGVAEDSEVVDRVETLLLGKGEEGPGKEMYDPAACDGVDGKLLAGQRVEPVNLRARDEVVDRTAALPGDDGRPEVFGMLKTVDVTVVLQGVREIVGPGGIGSVVVETRFRGAAQVLGEPGRFGPRAGSIGIVDGSRCDTEGILAPAAAGVVAGKYRRRRDLGAASDDEKTFGGLVPGRSRPSRASDRVGIRSFIADDGSRGKCDIGERQVSSLGVLIKQKLRSCGERNLLEVRGGEVVEISPISLLKRLRVRGPGDRRGGICGGPLECRIERGDRDRMENAADAVVGEGHRPVDGAVGRDGGDEVRCVGRRAAL